MARIKPKALLVQSKMKKGPSRISVSTIFMCTLLIVTIVVSIHAAYRYLSHRSNGRTETSSSMTVEDLKLSGETGKINTPKYAILDTAKGSITIELYNDESSDVVARFADKCRRGYFKGMLFHHVIKNYIIQGGDFDDHGGAQEWILKENSVGEVSVSPKHEAFMVGTTKYSNSHKGFDLFITTAPIPDLNEKLVVFGRVIKGEDIVQVIEEVDTDEQYRPKAPVGIIDIALKQDV